MKVDEYRVMRESVEAGVSSGWARAHKHHENPTPGQIQAAIEDAVMLQISEYFTFEGEEE